jgi:hypothetical protein
VNVGENEYRKNRFGLQGGDSIRDLVTVLVTKIPMQPMIGSAFGCVHWRHESMNEGG